MSSQRPFEIGLFTFGEITADPMTGQPIDPAVRLREFIDLAILADQAGLDVFGVGEHHRPDFAISSPPVTVPLLRAGQLHQRHRLRRRRRIRHWSPLTSPLSTVRQLERSRTG